MKSQSSVNEKRHVTQSSSPIVNPTASKIITPPPSPPSVTQLATSTPIFSAKSAKALETEVYPHDGKKGYDKIGVYAGIGVNYGRTVWEGPLGGVFFYNKNGNRSRVTDKKLIKYQID
jgi:hypothetical protein